MKAKFFTVLFLASLTTATCTVSAAIVNQNDTFTAGASMIERNGILVAPGGNQLTLFDEEGNILNQTSLDGYASYCSVLTDDYCFFGGGEKLFQMDLSDYSVKELAHDMLSCQPFGIIGDELYFTYATDPEEFEDTCLMSVNLENGQMTEFGTLPSMCGHSNFVTYGDRVFYSQGVADVGTFSIFFFDPNTGEVETIAPNCGGYLIDHVQLYYLSTDEPSERNRCQYDLVKYDITADKEEVLIGGADRLTGITIDAVDEDYVYLREYGQEDCSICTYSLQSGEIRNLISGPALSVINVIDHTIYWVYCDYENWIYTLNSYTVGTGEMQEEIMVSEDNFSYVTDQTIFTNAWSVGGGEYTAFPRN